MRILRLAERVPPEPGGKEIHVLELSRRQALRGHAVELWIRRGSRAIPGVDVRQVPLRLLGPGSLATTACYSSAVAAAVAPTRRQVDVVHAHGDFVEAATALTLARRFGAAAVLTVHGGLGERRWDRPRAMVFRHLDALLAAGPHVAAHAARLGVDPERIEVVTSGVDLALIGPPARPFAGSGTHVVSVGSLDPVKGHDVLLDAAGMLRREGRQVSVTIAGEGADRVALAARAGVSDRLVGQLTRREVYDVARTADLFVLASRPLPGKSEGVPTAVLEAMALGLPVISTRSGGLAHVIRDGETGLLVRSGDAGALAAAIAGLIDDPERARRLGAAARQSAARFSWECIVASVDSAYSAAIHRRRTDRAESAESRETVR